MTDTISVSASLHMQRSAHVVRAQYRDVDHHIRNNVHPSIHYQWEPSARGERKIRTTFRILGVPQYDVSLLEDAPDGSFVIRYLEGSNAGMVLVHRFVPVSENETRVELSAGAPSTLARKLMGPLFVIGARQVMKRALVEDKWDLEHGGFRADEPRGDIDAALATLRDSHSAPIAERKLLLELGFLIANIEGQPTLPQRAVLTRVANLLDIRTEGWLGDRLSEIEKSSCGEQLKDELARVASELGSVLLARHGLTLATTVAMMSDGLSQAELVALRHVGASVALGDDTVATVVDEVDKALGRGKRKAA